MTAAGEASPPFGQTCDSPSGRRYTEMAQWLHWIVAALALALIPVAWIMTSMGDGNAARGGMFSLHKSLGLTVWLLILARLIWRFTHPAPRLGPNTPAWIEWVGKLSHWAIYLAFFLMPISGFVTSSAGGHGVKFWGIPLPSLPKNEALSKLAGQAHDTGAWVVYVLLTLHVLATVYHVALRRDGVLQRMLPAQTRSDPA